jgi:hypothetical protein
VPRLTKSAGTLVPHQGLRIHCRVAPLLVNLLASALSYAPRTNREAVITRRTAIILTLPRFEPRRGSRRVWFLLSTLVMKGIGAPMGDLRVCIYLVLCGCAGAVSDVRVPESAESPSSLVRTLAGTWRCSGTLALAGRSPVVYSQSIRITTVGARADVTSLCPGSVAQRTERIRGPEAVGSNGSKVPSISALGSGATASWSGSLTCPSIEIPGCNLVEITYTTASLALSATTNLLTVVAKGTAVACGGNYPVFATLLGTP